MDITSDARRMGKSNAGRMGKSDADRMGNSDAGRMGKSDASRMGKSKIDHLIAGCLFHVVFVESSTTTSFVKTRQLRQDFGGTKISSIANYKP